MKLKKPLSPHFPSTKAVMAQVVVVAVAAAMAVAVVKPPFRTPNHHLHALGLTLQKPNYVSREQGPAAVERFINEDYHLAPTLQRHCH